MEDGRTGGKRRKTLERVGLVNIRHLQLALSPLTQQKTDCLKGVGTISPPELTVEGSVSICIVAFLDMTCFVSIPRWRGKLAGYSARREVLLKSNKNSFMVRKFVPFPVVSNAGIQELAGEMSATQKHSQKAYFPLISVHALYSS